MGFRVLRDATITERLEMPGIANTNKSYFFFRMLFTVPNTIHIFFKLSILILSNQLKSSLLSKAAIFSCNYTIPLLL
jgi:hypothetical protein